MIPNLRNSEVVLRPDDERHRWWWTDRPFDYTAPFDVGFPRDIVVPAGFGTNLASIPRVLWWLVPPFGRHTAPAVLHDYLYHMQFSDRAHADLVFWYAMGETGVDEWRRRAMYRGVRVGGWVAWRKHQRALLAPNTGNLDDADQPSAPAWPPRRTAAVDDVSALARDTGSVDEPRDSTPDPC